MPLNVDEVAEYLTTYVDLYRIEYARFTSPMPEGGGYPALKISPYLDADKIVCLIGKDGAVVMHLGPEPEDMWWIAGGPALMADFPETRTPPEVRQLLEQQGLTAKPIGIYRVVAPNGLPDEIWNGELPTPRTTTIRWVDETLVEVQESDTTLVDIIARLTFGALGRIVDLRLPNAASSPFWRPRIVHRLGFFPAERHRRRFINYLELIPHVEHAAWDKRGIPTRIQSDIRRDFAATVAPRSGTIHYPGANDVIHPLPDRLSTLARVIAEFRTLLSSAPNAPESVFHDFLMGQPILLDVYAEAVSKPRFAYPNGESPLGKAYVEPDFILKFPGRVYKLVELERPAKQIGTAQGQPRAEMNQAAFQIAEWRAYIRNHYELIKGEFPGIAHANDGVVVISRTSEASFGRDRDPQAYKELLRAQYPDTEILTYDDLLERAQQALVRLSSLGADA